MRAYIALACSSKAFNIGGTNLTQVNYGNISDDIGLIDSLKFYQRSLGELSSTLTAEEKIAVNNLAGKFLNFYFLTVWPYLSLKEKEKILEIISEGKGIMPYQITVDMESFFIKTENDFLEKSKFFSELKQNSKYLYQTLKMRNL